MKTQGSSKTDMVRQTGISGAGIAYIGARQQETTPGGSVRTYRFVFETNSKRVDICHILAKLFLPKSSVRVLVWFYVQIVESTLYHEPDSLLCFCTLLLDFLLDRVASNEAVDSHHSYVNSNCLPTFGY